MMRTTINLPDDIYEEARAMAASLRIPLGEAVGELARRGLQRTHQIDTSGVFPTFVLPPDAPKITLEQILAAEDEL